MSGSPSGPTPCTPRRARRGSVTSDMKRDRQPAAQPTLIDVAREAGVSPMTVSRVVRGTGLVGEATRIRV